MEEGLAPLRMNESCILLDTSSGVANVGHAGVHAPATRGFACLSPLSIANRALQIHLKNQTLFSVAICRVLRSLMHTLPVPFRTLTHIRK